MNEARDVIDVLDLEARRRDLEAMEKPKEFNNSSIRVVEPVREPESTPPTVRRTEERPRRKERNKVEGDKKLASALLNRMFEPVKRVNENFEALKIIRADMQVIADRIISFFEKEATASELMEFIDSYNYEIKLVNSADIADINILYTSASCTAMTEINVCDGLLEASTINVLAEYVDGEDEAIIMNSFDELLSGDYLLLTERYPNGQNTLQSYGLAYCLIDTNSVITKISDEDSIKIAQAYVDNNILFRTGIQSILFTDSPEESELEIYFTNAGKFGIIENNKSIFTVPMEQLPIKQVRVYMKNVEKIPRKAY